MSQKRITAYFGEAIGLVTENRGSQNREVKDAKHTGIRNINEEETNTIFVQNTRKQEENKKNNATNAQQNEVKDAKDTGIRNMNEEETNTIFLQKTRKQEENTKNNTTNAQQKESTSSKDTVACSRGEENICFNPGKTNYHPIQDACWKANEKVPYMALALTFKTIEDTRGRLKMVEILSNFFSSVLLLNPQDLLPCIYLCNSELGPSYEGLELYVTENTLIKVICETTGRTMKNVKAQIQAVGDLATVAEESRVTQRMMFSPSPLTVQGVFKKLKEIAKTTGPSKIKTIQNTFLACRSSEARYFMRSLMGKLRIGIAEQSLLNALATSLVNTPPGRLYHEEALNTAQKLSQQSYRTKIEDCSLLLKSVLSQCPSYEKIVSTILNHGLEELQQLCIMEPGMPVKPMLAQPTKSIKEVLRRFDGLDITCEWKYDGERAQIHYNNNGIVKIYSRNQEDFTSKYPDIVSRIASFFKNEPVSFIIDTEVVAWDLKRKTILPFQVLSTRKRKNVQLEDIKVDVCVFAFDILYLNGKTLVDLPLFERRRLLKDTFQEICGVWEFATSRDTNNVDEVQHFLEESIKGCCEGLMVKTLNVEATYEISKRSKNWLKLKKDYMSCMGDSLDLVVIGGYMGKGKRTGTYGGFLLACYDDENEEYQTICKIGTGFSDDDLLQYTTFFKQHLVESPKSYYRYENTLSPDDWFEPVQVWEVKCADLSLSPVHRAAIGIIDSERGISLRFPRFVRIRNDKVPENATSATEVAQLYSSQDVVQKNVSTFGENEFY